MTRTSLWRRWLSLGLVMVLTLILLPRDMVGFAYTEDRAEDITPDCTTYILQSERDNGIPSGLLLSIALVESGRKGRPYPWTLNMAGRSVYTASRKEALSRMKDRHGNVPRNTMVGCMQVAVNLHKQKFDSVDQVIDPEHNVAYAAAYLKRHYQHYGNWISAIQRYNGGKKKQLYACRVWYTYENLGVSKDGKVKKPTCQKTASADIAPDLRDLFTSLSVAQVP